MKTSLSLLLCLLSALVAGSSFADSIKVMRSGLGTGSVTSVPAGISCGSSCDFTYSATTMVMLTAFAEPGSVFAGWNVDRHGMSPSPDCSGASPTCMLSMASARSVKAKFDPSPAIAPLMAAVPDAITPREIQTYLDLNPNVRTPAQFLAALPEQYRQGWMLMTRSESLQTGTAQFPRILLSSNSGKSVFTLALSSMFFRALA